MAWPAGYIRFKVHFNFAIMMMMMIVMMMMRRRRRTMMVMMMVTLSVSIESTVSFT